MEVLTMDPKKYKNNKNKPLNMFDLLNNSLGLLIISPIVLFIAKNSKPHKIKAPLHLEIMLNKINKTVSLKIILIHLFKLKIAHSIISIKLLMSLKLSILLKIIFNQLNLCLAILQHLIPAP